MRVHQTIRFKERSVNMIKYDSFEKMIELADACDEDAMVAAIQEIVWQENYEVKLTPEIHKKLIKYLKNAFELGNIDVLNQLGAMFAEGRMVEKDLKKAFMFYKMADACGNMLSTSNLGFCYLYGLGTDKDYEKAYKTFSKAALCEYGEAMIRVADMYCGGLYVEKDQSYGHLLYYRSMTLAEKDLTDWGNIQVYSDACKKIADIYYYGNGTIKNYELAKKYYQEALKYYEIRNNLNDAYSYDSYVAVKRNLETL